MEKKYADIEARKEAYKSQLSEYTLPNSEAKMTQYDMDVNNVQHHLHTPRKEMSDQVNKQIDHPDFRVEHLIQQSRTSGGQNFLNIDSGNLTSFRVDTSGSSGSSRDEEHIRRIRDYQSKLLERQRQKKQLIEERQSGGAPEHGSEWLQTRHENEGYLHTEKNLVLSNETRIIPLSAQMASGQYFGIADRLGHSFPNAAGPSVSGYYGNVATGFESTGVDDIYQNISLHPAIVGVDVMNVKPPEQDADSPSHRVQGWLSYYQQLEQLSSKEPSPQTANVSRPLAYVSSGKIGPSDQLSQKPHEHSFSKDKQTEDLQLPSTTLHTNDDSSTQTYGLSAYSRHLVQDMRENILRTEGNLHGTTSDNAGSSSEFGNIKNFNLSNEGKSALQNSDRTDIVAQLNDLSLGTRSSLDQELRLLPTFQQYDTEEGHIPHELSTIQELEEQSTRKHSQLGALSTGKKRLSSSPIKEDSDEVSDNVIFRVW